MFGTAMLSIADVAVRLGFSRDAVRRAIRRGELPAVKVLGQYRVDPVQLERWLREQRVTPSPAAAAPVRRRRRTPGAEGGSFRERARRGS